MKIEEINVFTNGDARKLSTWSNFPYFFTESLKSKGIKVNYINTQPNRILKNIYKFSIWQILKRIKKYDSYDYYRTKTNRIFANRIIENGVKKYPNADANLFLNFSFSAKPFSSKPTILFGDWTYELYFKQFKIRKPSNLEQSFIDAENNCIENANAVFVMFPKMAKLIQARYKNPNIYNLSGYFINSTQAINADDIIQQKLLSYKLLFIGTIKYIEGANILIDAVSKLLPKYPKLEVHIIGMKSSDFNKLPDFVHCYGYLDKAKNDDRNAYNNLMQSAKMIVNTTPKWSGFSSVIEAMYFYNPVITTAYDDFLETFDTPINFGILNESNNTLAEEISNIIEDKNYTQLCTNAHEAVKDFTWEKYINKFIKVLESL